MVILHCLKESEWNTIKNEKFYGEHYINSNGFIHCSDVQTLHKVAWMFLKIPEPLVILCIDTSRVQADIKWENGGSTDYPHIYGLLNLDSIINVLPFIKDSNNQFVFNQELQQYIV